MEFQKLACNLKKKLHFFHRQPRAIWGTQELQGEHLNCQCGETKYFVRSQLSGDRIEVSKETFNLLEIYLVPGF